MTPREARLKAAAIELLRLHDMHAANKDQWIALEELRHAVTDGREEHENDDEHVRDSQLQDVRPAPPVRPLAPQPARALREIRMEIHPRNLESLLVLVQCWQADHAQYAETRRGSDGTGFPPKWPLTHEETATLIMLLAGMRATPEPTVAAGVAG